MKHTGWLLLAAIWGLWLVGCSARVEKDPNSTSISTPEEAVAVFLGALRAGDNEKATLVLTSKARREMVQRDLEVKSPGSPTAGYQIGQVEYLGEDNGGAHVASTWTDPGQPGSRDSYQIIWILRMEEAGWRIAGMAAELFEDELPLILNFEEPDEMVRKVDQADQEMARRNSSTLR